MRLKIAIVSTIVISILVILAAKWYVWIPDLFSNRTIVLGQMNTSDGDYFRVTQKFVGDGYLTLFDHTNKFGQSWHSGFDGDARKAWSADFEKTNSAVVIHVLHQTFYYNLATHKIIDSKGDERFVNEKAAALTNSPDLFRVAINARSGQYAAVSKNAEVLALKDKSGNPVWEIDIIKKFGSQLALYSNQKIKSLEFAAGEIVVCVGNRFICIEPETGKTIRTGLRKGDGDD